MIQTMKAEKRGRNKLHPDEVKTPVTVYLKKIDIERLYGDKYIKDMFYQLIKFKLNKNDKTI